MTREASVSLWGCDVAVSMPQPLDTSDVEGAQVDFGGFGFTGNGLVHNLSAVDREALIASGFAPPVVGSPHG